MSLISYRDLVGIAYTEEETKAMTAEIEVEDGPNDEGGMFTRPSKQGDRFPQPYANEQVAWFANGGAYPPDLSLITKARHNGQNYVFALLTVTLILLLQERLEKEAEILLVASLQTSFCCHFRVELLCLKCRFCYKLFQIDDYDR